MSTLNSLVSKDAFKPPYYDIDKEEKPYIRYRAKKDNIKYYRIIPIFKDWGDITVLFSDEETPSFIKECNYSFYKEFNNIIRIEVRDGYRYEFLTAIKDRVPLIIQDDFREGIKIYNEELEEYNVMRQKQVDSYNPEKEHKAYLKRLKELNKNNSNIEEKGCIIN